MVSSEASRVTSPWRWAARALGWLQGRSSTIPLEAPAGEALGLEHQTAQFVPLRLAPIAREKRSCGPCERQAQARIDRSAAEAQATVSRLHSDEGRLTTGTAGPIS